MSPRPAGIHISPGTLEVGPLPVHGGAMDTFESVAGAAAGLFSYRQLRREGYTDEEIRTARMAGRLVRLHRGVYALGTHAPGADRSVEKLRIVGVAARSPSMVVSHASAAVLHDLPLWGIDSGAVHLTKRSGGGSLVAAAGVVHAASVPTDHNTRVRGVPVTSVAWTRPW